MSENKIFENINSPSDNETKKDKVLKATYNSALYFKKQYKDEIQKTGEELLLNMKVEDENDTISLFHGTSTHYLGEILKNGILSRENTSISNWEKNPSIGNVTYLTNKWHYFYGINSVIELNNKGIHSYPCYIECKIPKSLLIVDEDFFLSKYVIKKINTSMKKGKGLELEWDECLNHYGTAGVIGNIPVKYIESFTVIADGGLIEKLIDEKGQYYNDFKRWQEGKGKGKLRINDLMLMETSSNKNATWWLKNFSKEIDKSNVCIEYDKSRDKMTMRFDTPR